MQSGRRSFLTAGLAGLLGGLLGRIGLGKAKANDLGIRGTCPGAQLIVGKVRPEEERKP